jgi:putative addiction module component (TIGR02574 family)
MRFMSTSVPLPPPGFDELPIDDRVDYVQTLWDRIAAKPEDLPVPDWHLDVIRDRLAEYRRSPNTGRPWSVVRDELLRKLRSRTG